MKYANIQCPKYTGSFSKTNFEGLLLLNRYLQFAKFKFSLFEIGMIKNLNNFEGTQTRSSHLQLPFSRCEASSRLQSVKSIYVDILQGKKNFQDDPYFDSSAFFSIKLP